MKNLILITALMLLLIQSNAQAQEWSDSAKTYQLFTNLDEALKNPERVYRLNLSNQQIQIPDDTWKKFTNLEFLSLKNDQLQEIPSGIVQLKKLKVLDLSGNNFKLLPSSFNELTSLEELYLNDEKQMNLQQSIEVLSLMPNLKTLHLENDGLRNLPANFAKLDKVENLYLNNNRFNQIPTELKGMKNLRYLDFHENKLKPSQMHFPNQGLGLKIVF